MRRPLVGAALLLFAAIVCSWLAEALTPIRILLPGHFAFAPCDLTVRVRLHPLPSDRVLIVAAFDRRSDPPLEVQHSERTITGEDTPRLAVIPWRLDAGDYAIVATVGSAGRIRARAVELFHVIGRE